MNLNLTRDEADRLDADGRVVLFRRGRLSTISDGFPARLLPPAEFVEVAQPCETCGGSGQGRLLVDFGNGGPVPKCWDCVDGQRRIAAVVPCDGIIGSRWRINDTGGTFTVRTVAGQYAYVANERGTERRILAHRVRSSRAKTGYTRIDDGLVTVAIVVVESGPAIVSRSHVEGALHIVEMQTHDGPQWFICDCDEMCEPFDPPDVDPATLVGQYALGIRVANERNPS